jgi:hypothetical protein
MYKANQIYQFANRRTRKKREEKRNALRRAQETSESSVQNRSEQHPNSN